MQVEQYYDRTEDIKTENAVSGALQRYKTASVSGLLDDALEPKSIIVDPLTHELKEVSFVGNEIPALITVPEAIYNFYGVRIIYNLLFGDGSAKEDAEDWASKKAAGARNELFEKFYGEEAGGKIGAPEGVVRTEDLQNGGKPLKDELDGMSKYMKKLDGQMKYIVEQTGIIRIWIDNHEEYHNKPKTQKKRTSYNKKGFALQPYNR